MKLAFLRSTFGFFFLDFMISWAVKVFFFFLMHYFNSGDNLYLRVVKLFKNYWKIINICLGELGSVSFPYFGIEMACKTARWLFLPRGLKEHLAAKDSYENGSFQLIIWMFCLHEGKICGYFQMLEKKYLGTSRCLT